MIKLLICSLMLVLLFSMNVNYIYAQVSLTNSSDITITTPDHLSNFFDRIKEKIIMFIKFSPQSKTDYQLQLVDERLNDLIYVINTKQGDLIEEMSSRYQTYVNRLGELALSGNSDKSKLITNLNNNVKILEKLNSQFQANNAFWLLTEHDINSTKETIAKIQSH